MRIPNKNTIGKLYNRMPKNFITPNVVRYEVLHDRVIELATNEEKDYWGVSELMYTDKTRYSFESTERGQSFKSRHDALRHYTMLSVFPHLMKA